MLAIPYYFVIRIAQLFQNTGQLSGYQTHVEYKKP